MEGEKQMFDPDVVDAKAVHVACIQMCVKSDGSPRAKAANLAKAIQMLERAKDAGAEIACLPEMCSVGYDLEALDGKLAGLAESVSADLKVTPFLGEISACAKRLSLAVIVPTPEVECVKDYSWEQGQDGFPHQRIYSTAFVFDTTGRLMGKHRKVHLRVEGSSGYQNYRDDKVLTYGSDTNTFTLQLSQGRSLRFGVILGSDLEFSHFDNGAPAPQFTDKAYNEENDLVRTMGKLWDVQAIFCATATDNLDWTRQGRLAATNGKVGGLLFCGSNQTRQGCCGRSVVWNGKEMDFDKKAMRLGELDHDREDVLVVKLPLHL